MLAHYRGALYLCKEKMPKTPIFDRVLLTDGCTSKQQILDKCEEFMRTGVFNFYHIELCTVGSVEDEVWLRCGNDPTKDVM